MWYGNYYDIIVVGAGHAGCEAALAAARMGASTLLATISMDNIALMPCNPSIGGPAKGHLVREIDALGGQMGITADMACIQMRMLNTGKGHAVRAPRSQADKHLYQTLMKEIIEKQENLDLKQLMIDEIIIEDNCVKGVKAETGEVFRAEAVILATGTYLCSKIIYGQVVYDAGPNGLRSALKLSDSLRAAGVELMRFKTGTPARVDARSLDYSKMQEQPGDAEQSRFSFMPIEKNLPQVSCYLTYTNLDTHKMIMDNLHQAAMFNGLIEGVGPRYCPSIESKLVRFTDKERHQLFIEPEGLQTTEMYVQGMSTSLPADIQIKFLRTIPGLENAKMMRAGYAIDYDCLNPLQLKATLEHKKINGLFSAGQANGTSGYEEAAAQGLMAGINAVCKLQGLEEFILSRSDAYIGVLIDDLVTKGTNEPYRMMTSRAEYRLLLRQDNADLRLTKKGWDVGLVDADRYSRYYGKKQAIEQCMELLEKTTLSPSEQTLEKLQSINTMAIKSGVNLLELLRRPELNYDILKPLFSLPDLEDEVKEQVEIQVKYEGYIKKQEKEVQKANKLESKKIPADIDYTQIKELGSEAREKLIAHMPISIGQASRISGVSPADINVLLIYLEQKRRQEQDV